MKVWSWRVVLNITFTEPSTENSEPMFGRPMPAERLTVSMPATPALRPGVTPVWMISRPVASP